LKIRGRQRAIFLRALGCFHRLCLRISLILDPFGNLRTFFSLAFDFPPAIFAPFFLGI
jgi:hypothetical protein